LEKNLITEEVCRNEFRKDIATGKFEYWVQCAIAKLRIEEWDMSAVELENIFDYIYCKDRIPKFYKKVEEDFNNKFKDLETSIGALEVLPREFLENEKSSTNEFKDLSDQAEALEKLQKAGFIGGDEFKKMKQNIQEKLKRLVSGS